MTREEYAAARTPLRDLMRRLADADAVRELQGGRVCGPVPGDVDLFTGAVFVAPVPGGGEQLGLW